MLEQGRRAGWHGSLHLALLLRALRPAASFLDATYPHLLFRWAMPEASAVSIPGVIRPEAEAFYSRFRQAGGRYAIPSILDATSPASRTGRPDDDACGTSILLVRACDAAQLAGADLGSAISMLVFAGRSDGEGQRLGGFEEIGFGHRLALRFRFGDADVAEECSIISRTPLEIAVVRTALEGGGEGVGAVEVEEASGESSRPSFNVRLLGRGDVPGAVSSTARQFIHDGKKAAEESDGYSWLWITGERHLRLLLGRIPDHFRSVRVIVANALSPANLGTARLFLNGELLASSAQTWPGGGGVVAAELPRRRDGEQVLGFALQEAQVLNGEVLSACIDRIEFLA